MKDAVDWAAALQAMSRADQLEFLDSHSGLPGTRANLSLVSAVARIADADLIADLEASDDEYLLMCAATARGLRADDPRSIGLLRTYAMDDRWRVREGAVMGLQMLGDSNITALVRIVMEWANGSDPLLQRAAVAALCEPRLLREPTALRAALDVCFATTEQFTGWTAARRRASGARTLRQALGYCWSIVVAADPTTALPVFLGLDTADADIAWIVKENRRKSRLARILQDHS